MALFGGASVVQPATGGTLAHPIMLYYYPAQMSSDCINIDNTGLPCQREATLLCLLRSNTIRDQNQFDACCEQEVNEISTMKTKKQPATGGSTLAEDDHRGPPSQEAYSFTASRSVQLQPLSTSTRMPPRDLLVTNRGSCLLSSSLPSPLPLPSDFQVTHDGPGPESATEEEGVPIMTDKDCCEVFLVDDEDKLLSLLPTFEVVNSTPQQD